MTSTTLIQRLLTNPITSMFLGVLSIIGFTCLMLFLSYEFMFPVLHEAMLNY